MKKLILPLVLLAGVAYADSIPATANSVPRQGSFSTSAAVMYGVNGANFVPMAVSANGQTLGNVTITSLPMASASSGMVAYTAASETALTITISAKSFITLASGPAAAAGYKFQFTNSVTAPWNLTTGAQVGSYNATTTTSQVWAFHPCWLHIAGQSAAAAPWVQIDPVQ